MPKRRDPLTLTDAKGRPLYYRTHRGVLRRSIKPTKKQYADMKIHVYKRDNYTCKACGWRAPEEAIARFEADSWWSPPRLVLDHKKPYRDGGTFTKQNIHTLCETCNAARAATPWKVFLASREGVS